MVHVGAIGQHRTGRPGCRLLGGVERGVLGETEVRPLHRDVRGEPAGHDAGGSPFRGDIAQIHEQLEVLEADLARGTTNVWLP